MAVLAVIFYHAGLSCPGGFVGVDVFFVISGYLITALLLRDLQAGTFSLAAFFERRVRRIFPALVVMVVATLVAGVFLPSPWDFAKLGQSAVAQSLMSANVFFWRQPEGYFGDHGFHPPLKHTWSLAVEEQFYLVLPLLLLLWRRKVVARPDWLRRWLLIALLLSLVLAVALLSLSNKRASVFYNLPTRAWELLGGALLAAWPVAWFRAGRGLREIVSWLGLAGILAPVWLYSDQTLFPGLAALPPVLGAMALIWANADTQRTVPGRLLAWKPVVAVGLISYSLYLWHWPVLAYLHYGQLDLTNLPPFERWVPVVVAVVLAFLSWRCIEVPFREKRLAGSRRSIFGLGLVGSVIVIAMGGTVAASRGWPTRMSAAMQENNALMQDIKLIDDVTTKAVSTGLIPKLDPVAGDAPVEVLLWGDSHAKHSVAAMSALCQELGVSGEVVAYSSTPPVRAVFHRPFGLWEKSPEWFDAVVRHIQTAHIKYVVLAAYWSQYAEEDSARLKVRWWRRCANSMHSAVVCGFCKMSQASMWMCQEP